MLPEASRASHPTRAEIMSQQSKQNLKNHSRYVPLYHFVLPMLVGMVLVRSAKHAIAQPSYDAAMNVALDVALVLTAWYARAFALTAQDRIIRLEMKLRMQSVAPQQAVRFAQFTPSQLTALRFAGDGELPGLAQQVLDGTLRTGAAIKQRISDWQADDLRV